MIFLKNLIIQFVLSSDKMNPEQSFGLETDNYIQLTHNKPYSSLAELFDNFVLIASKEFAVFNCGHFRKLLSIISSYPYVHNKEYVIPFLNGTRSQKGPPNLLRTVFGHFYYLKSENVECCNYFSLNIRNQLLQKDYQNVRDLMNIFQGYHYFTIFRNTKDDDLLYYITLLSLLENMGIICLKLICKNPYYKTDSSFIRDFMTNSASILHSINVVYKVSLDDSRIMNVFKVFVVKNLKLLCIFWNFWEVSYNLIFKKMNNINTNLRICSVNFNVTTSYDLITDEIRCLKLDEFNYDMQLLFEFILKIDLDLTFKKKFEILKATNNFKSKNMEYMVENLDTDGILNFFTGNFEDGKKKCKEPLYFLNTLDLDISIPDNILAEITINLLFITNKKIRKYFITMLWIAYSKNIEHLDQIFEHFSTKKCLKTIDELESEKKTKMKLHKFEVYDINENFEILGDGRTLYTMSPNFFDD